MTRHSAYWAKQGVDAERLSHVEPLDVQIADPSDSVLGSASMAGNSVWIDRDAAGFGWSPSTDGDGVDLLSTVIHEASSVMLVVVGARQQVRYLRCVS